MAGGRDLSRRSPRWLNGVIWSSGLAALVGLIWRMVMDDCDTHGVALSFTSMLCRLVAAAVLPALLILAAVARAARRLVEGA